ncbi:MAG: uroporphyrinogen-III synthase [Chloroflexi bacterium]|nr:uroporphyrinogen-III synthase [Chloroflexota bacterium]
MTAAVLLTRPTESAGALGGALRARGLRVHRVPSVELRPEPVGTLEAAAGRLRRGDWIVVASPFAAQLVGGAGRGFAPGVRVAAIGSGTADALQRGGVEALAVATLAEPAALVVAMSAGGSLRGRRVVLPRSDLADDALPAVLAAAGEDVETVIAYRTIEAPRSSLPLLRTALADPGLRVAVVASGSAARGLAALLTTVGSLGVAAARSLPVVSIGPATTSEARGVGLIVAAEAARATVADLVHSVRRVAAAQSPARPLEGGSRR